LLRQVGASDLRGIPDGRWRHKPWVTQRAFVQVNKGDASFENALNHVFGQIPADQRVQLLAQQRFDQVYLRFVTKRCWTNVYRNEVHVELLGLLIHGFAYLNPEGVIWLDMNTDANSVRHICFLSNRSDETRSGNSMDARTGRVPFGAGEIARHTIKASSRHQQAGLEDQRSAA
jgi:hypothetical protein